MPYPYEQIFAADESAPEKVATNGVVTIFAPGDPARTPLAITTLDGLPLSNPMQVNDAGFGPAFMHATLDQVAWAGGGGSFILSTAPASSVGWHTAVVSYRKNGDESISLDGGAVAKGEVHNVNTAVSTSNFGMSGRPEHRIRVMDYAFINRALTDAEHGKVHAALASQIPS